MGYISDLVRGNGFNNGGGMMQHQGAPVGGYQGGTGLLNGGPRANFNGMNVGNTVPFKGGTTEAQMQKNIRDYWASRKGAQPTGSFSGGTFGTDMDPRRSPDVAAPWRIAQPYAGPVNGGTPLPPNQNQNMGPTSPDFIRQYMDMVARWKANGGA